VEFLDFDSNQLGLNAPLDFFFSSTRRLLFHYAMNVRKGVGALEFVFLGTKSREVMKEFNNFKNGCGGNHHLC